MVKGFIKDNKFHPTGGQPVGKSSKQKTIDPTEGTLIKEPTFEFTPRERPVRFEVAEELFNEFRKDLPDNANFSFDPVTNTGYDFRNKDEALDFHNQFVEGRESNAVFIISVQNHLGRFLTRTSQSAYEDVKNDGLDPIIGGSFSIKAQEPFTDISFAISGIDSEEAFDLARENGQDFVAIVNNDGEFFVPDVPEE